MIDAFATSENKDRVDNETGELLIRRNGKILYAIAYENPLPGIRYILAKNYSDARTQVMRSRRDYGKVVSIGPAVGMHGKHVERKRIYCFGT